MQQQPSTLVRSESSISSIGVQSSQSQESLLSHTMSTNTPHHTFAPFFHHQQHRNNFSNHQNSSSEDSLCITIETEQGDSTIQTSSIRSQPATTTTTTVTSMKTLNQSSTNATTRTLKSQPPQEPGLFASLVDSLLEYFEDWFEDPGEKTDQVAEAKTQMNNGMY